MTNSEDTDEDTDEEKITKTDQENASTLADLFTFVFTIEPDSELPDLDTTDVPKLNIFNIDNEMVHKNLESLKIDKLPGQDV